MRTIQSPLLQGIFSSGLCRWRFPNLFKTYPRASPSTNAGSYSTRCGTPFESGGERRYSHSSNSWINGSHRSRVLRKDLVILTDELAPSARWPLAIITKVHSGKDGLVRVVSLRPSKTDLVRPIVKLLRVPPDNDAEETFAHHSASVNTRQFI